MCRGPSQFSGDSLQRALQSNGKWRLVVDYMGFPAGLWRATIADLTGKLPKGTRRIRLTTNLQIYWDQILIDRTPDELTFHSSEIPLASAKLDFHGFPRSIERGKPGDLDYIYEQTSRTGPYTRPVGAYTSNRRCNFSAHKSGRQICSFRFRR